MTSSTDHTKNSTRVAAGLKAAIHNPNVSNEARKHARERLEKMKAAEPELQSKEQGSHTQAGEGSPGSRVLAGYKATLTNPYTSQEAKQHAEEVLQAAGIHEKNPDHTEEQHMTRVIAGYKAALRNPRVSEEAKEHAREFLSEHDVEV